MTVTKLFVGLVSLLFICFQRYSGLRCVNDVAILGFPRVLGYVDGTFIWLQTPTENEPENINRKGYRSLM